MIRPLLVRLQLFSCFCLPLGALALEMPLILPLESPDADSSHRIVWPTESGIYYELQQSTDLITWTTVAGFLGFRPARTPSP